MIVIRGGRPFGSPLPTRRAAHSRSFCGASAHSRSLSVTLGHSWQVPAERWARWELPLGDCPLDPKLTRRMAHAGFLADAELFDAALFGVTESDAARMDPHHRVLLEASFEALAGALNAP
eukprot:4844519-Pyramimonas_sp.AAC.1